VAARGGRIGSVIGRIRIATSFAGGPSCPDARPTGLLFREKTASMAVAGHHGGKLEHVTAAKWRNG